MNLYSAVVELQLITRNRLLFLTLSLDGKRAEGSLPGNLVGTQPTFFQLAAPLLDQRRIKQENLITFLEVSRLDLLVIAQLDLVAFQALDVQRLISKGLQHTQMHADQFFRNPLNDQSHALIQLLLCHAQMLQPSGRSCSVTHQALHHAEPCGQNLPRVARQYARRHVFIPLVVLLQSPLANPSQEQTIRSFVLSGHLRVVRCAKPVLDSHLHTIVMKFTLEVRSVVSDDCCWHPKPVHHLVCQKFHRCHRICILDGFGFDLLG